MTAQEAVAVKKNGADWAARMHRVAGALGLSRDDLAARLDISPAALLNILSRRSAPGPNTASLLMSLEMQAAQLQRRAEQQDKLVALVADPDAPRNVRTTGRGLRACRMALRLTQAELAPYLGTSATSMSRWEHDQVQIPLAACDALRALLRTHQETGQLPPVEMWAAPHLPGRRGQMVRRLTWWELLVRWFRRVR